MVEMSRIPKPALATLRHDRFWEPGWVYERKLDGQRVLGVRDGADARLYSRSGRDVTVAFPEVAEALAEQGSGAFVVDGEVVAFEGSRTSFGRLQGRIGIHDPERARRSGVRVFYYVFDVLRLDGDDVREAPLRARKARLRDAIRFADPLRIVAHRNAAGEEAYRDACRRGWEGVIAKRADSPYSSKRSKDWLKFKCGRGQELVIGGFTEPKGSRIEFGALLMGYFDGAGELRYAGKVGTGFDRDLLRSLGGRMRALARDASPFADDVRERGTTWVEPELVAQIGFSEWTRDGRLRHPRFLGLRDDKPARQVVREGA